jgi:hypothetical protein
MIKVCMILKKEWLSANYCYIQKIEECGPVAEIHFFWYGGGGQSLLNFRQNFQISYIPPPPPPICTRKDCF